MQTPCIVVLTVTQRTPTFKFRNSSTSACVTSTSALATHTHNAASRAPGRTNKGLLVLGASHSGTEKLAGCHSSRHGSRSPRRSVTRHAGGPASRASQASRRHGRHDVTTSRASQGHASPAGYWERLAGVQASCRVSRRRVERVTLRVCPPAGWCPRRDLALDHVT